MQDPYLNKRFGNLAPVRQLHNGLWRYRCERIKANGEVCGIFRDLRRKTAKNYFCCATCAEFLREQPRPRRKKTVSLRNYLKVRADFTPEQWRFYYQILRGRKSVEDQRDAVELVLIEQPGQRLSKAA